MRKEELLKLIDKKEKVLLKLKDDLANNYKNYKTILVLHLNTTLMELAEIKDNIKKILDEINNIDEIGIKKLAYEIKGNKEAYYILYNWQGTRKDLVKIEKYLRETDNVLKFLTVRIDED